MLLGSLGFFFSMTAVLNAAIIALTLCSIFALRFGLSIPSLMKNVVPCALAWLKVNAIMTTAMACMTFVFMAVCIF